MFCCCSVAATGAIAGQCHEALAARSEPSLYVLFRLSVSDALLLGTGKALT